MKTGLFTKKRICVLLSLALIFIMAGCGNHAAESSRESIMSEQAVQTEQTLDNNEDSSGAHSQETSASVSELEQEDDMGNKTLVVYFSATGTTRSLAEYAAEILNADIYEIVAEDSYTEADLAYYTNGRADQEQNDASARPAISGNVENMEQYDTIILGYPIWHGQAPRIISTFLENYDFSGKTVIPFCTSHSSGIGSSADDLHSLCSGSTIWADGRRFEAGTSRDMIKEWLDSI